jgi:hypothetical protein
MTGETSEALDQALWLHQAPGRRKLLQARPLAEGQELLLRIAAGSGSALEAAAAATGQPAQRIGEATRFYLQQVLFTDDADAYRVLGLQRGASADEIRHHHRLLQRWLHPDRSDDPWNEVFAARVNQAWTALRGGGAHCTLAGGHARAGQPRPGPLAGVRGGRGLRAAGDGPVPAQRGTARMGGRAVRHPGAARCQRSGSCRIRCTGPTRSAATQHAPAGGPDTGRTRHPGACASRKHRS